MAGTRASTRNHNSSSAPNTPEKQSPGQKRKATNSSPASGRGRKQQKTLEETAPDDSEMKEAAEKAEDAEKDVNDENAEAKAATSAEKDSKPTSNEDSAEAETKQEASDKNAENADGSVDVEETDLKTAPTDDGAVERSPGRGDKVPSNILEKGIFYFFARGRVGVDNAESVQDIARSYLVLRPLPKDAKLTEGPIEDLKNNRLLALPKKVMPKGHRDAFMTFVEKGQTTIQDLKDNFLAGSEYSTKTTGVRHTPPATPLVEGVYAITDTGRNSHFAYVVTIPEELGEVQQDVGFHSRGSFVLSLKNPDQKGPANASLPQAPEWPEEMQKEFHGLRWMAVQPKFMDYANAQLLLIGEGRDELGKAVETSTRDEKHEKETPEEELNLLEDEDSHRTGQLHGEDSVFDDLGISSKDYPKVKSTW